MSMLRWCIAYNHVEEVVWSKKKKKIDERSWKVNYWCKVGVGSECPIVIMCSAQCTCQKSISFPILGFSSSWPIISGIPWVINSKLYKSSHVKSLVVIWTVNVLSRSYAKSIHSRFNDFWWRKLLVSHILYIYS